MELCFGLFALGLFLVFWAAVGHGMWLLAVTVWRAAFAPENLEHWPDCANCHRTKVVPGGRCTHCGHLQRVGSRQQMPLWAGRPEGERRPETDQAAVIRHLQGLLARGLITSTQLGELASHLRLSPPTEFPPGVIEAEIVYLEPAEREDLAQHMSAVAVSHDETNPFAAVANPTQQATGYQPEPPPVWRGRRPSQPATRHPLDPSPHTPTATATHPPTRPPLAEMLQAFLEEKNIRWGEILAGLFIVISAVGLIISLRNTLEAIPYFPALMFMLFTLLFHGAGLYSLKRWNLHAVSRVVLIISLLLVPLSFGAGIVLSGSGEARRPLGDPYVIIAIVTAIVAFSWVAWSSARELVGRSAWQVYLAVMGTAIGQIVINRVPLENPQGWPLVGLAALPLLSFLAPIGSAIATNTTVRQFAPRRAAYLLLLTGVGLFALLVPLALLLFSAASKRLALAELSPLLSLAACAVLGVGVLLHRKVRARSLAVWQTAGTSLAVLASFAMVVLLALAWPWPAMLTAVGVLDGLVLLALAWFVELPILYAAGVAALTMSYLVGFHWLRGVLPAHDQMTSGRLLEALLQVPGAVALMVWNAAIVGAALLLRHRGGLLPPRPSLVHRVKRSKAAGRVLLASAAGVGALVLLLAANAGFAPWMPENAWPLATSTIFVIYAVVLLLATRFVPHPALPAMAAAVWWLALVHLLSFDSVVRGHLEPLRDSLRLVEFPTLLHALSTAAIACLLARTTLWASDARFAHETHKRQWRVWVLPLAVAALLTSAAATLGVFVPWSNLYNQQAIELAIVAFTWLLLTLLTRQPAGVPATQLAIHAAVAMAIAGRWYGEAESGWYLAGSHVIEQLAAVALLATIWNVLRVSTERTPTLRGLLRDWPTVDEILLPGGVIALVAVLSTGLAPAISAELGWTSIPKTNDTAWLGSWTTLSYQPLAWITAAILLAGYCVRMWERLTADALAGLLLALAATPALAAGLWADELAAGSALRWGLAMYALVATALVAGRNQLLELARRVPRWREAILTGHEIEQLRYLALTLSAGPIVVLTVTAVATSLLGMELGGPLPESFFGRMGLTASYGVPLVAVVGSLMAFAVREQRSAFALAGTAVFQGAVNLVLLLYLKDAGFTYVREAAVLSLQVNAIGCAAFALLWLGLDPWIERDSARRTRFPRRIDIPLFFLTRLVALIALWAVAAIVVSPSAMAPWDARLAGPLSFVAVALNVAAIVWRYGLKVPAPLVQGIVLLSLCLSALAALASDVIAPWRGFLVLETSWMAIGAMATLAAWLWRSWEGDATAEPVLGNSAGASLSQSLRTYVASLYLWRRHVDVEWARLPHMLAWRGVTVVLLAAALAVYGGWGSPLHPWYSLAVIAAAQACFVAQGLYLRSQRVAWLSGLLAIATGIVIYGDPQWPRLHSSYEGALHATGIPGLSLATIAVVWLGIELWFQRRQDESLSLSPRALPMHQFAVWGLIAASVWLTGLAWFGFVLRLGAPELFVIRTETVALLVVVGLLLAGMLWDRRASAIPMLYLWGIAATCLAIVVIHPPRDWAFVSVLLAAAAYLAITSHLWKWGADLAGLALRLGIAEPVAGLVRTSRWLPGVSMAGASGLAAVSVIAVLLLPQRDMRMAASVAPLLLAWCASSLAQERRKEPLLLATFLLGALAAVCVGWADLPPQHSPDFWLIRTIRLLMALSFATLLYGLVVPRWIFAAGDWHLAARRAAGLLGSLALASLVAVLLLEAALFVPGRGAPISDPQLIAVSVVIAGLVIGLFSLALLPGRDPLGLDEEGRMYYVYAGEVTAALLFAHLYLARPGLFDETLRPYWPFIIVALAFGSVALSELFKRSGIRVLAQPLERTGGLLPLLPALGFWFLASRTDYSAVLFSVGLLYLLHSWLRQSFTSGIAAAVAGNGALWAWLAKEESRSFFEHPQFWLIPPAVSVLIGAHLQRRRLDPAALTAIRYASTLVIYLSSTSEMFIVGLGENLWPPMVLALLGLAGALAGMLLQIRAFLYLGCGFVLLALVSMVAHAAQAIDHVWPWWAFGIGVGIAILILFGIFEKKRAEVMSLIERLRQWES